MRIVIQRVSEAAVSIAGEVIGQIGCGLVLLLGIEDRDTEADIDYLVRKTVQMRLFPDAGGMMNKSVLDMGGELLIVSQFTLLANTRKGNRPSYIRASKPSYAEPLYEAFCAKAEAETGCPVQRGRFGADMQVSIMNDGPVTIIMDSHER